MDFKDMVTAARNVIDPRDLSSHAKSGGVGASLLSASGKLYTGVCVETACSMGFCAEQAAAGTMITRGENHVVKMVAVAWKDQILPPCGRCREFVQQLHPHNRMAKVMVADDVVHLLGDLLPLDWRG